jgi:hypothetical protein
MAVTVLLLAGLLAWAYYEINLSDDALCPPGNLNCGEVPPSDAPAAPR